MTNNTPIQMPKSVLEGWANYLSQLSGEVSWVKLNPVLSEMSQVLNQAPGGKPVNVEAAKDKPKKKSK